MKRYGLVIVATLAALASGSASYTCDQAQVDILNMRTEDIESLSTENTLYTNENEFVASKPQLKGKNI